MREYCASMKSSATNSKHKPVQILQDLQSQLGSAAIELAPSMLSKCVARKIIGRAREKGQTTGAKINWRIKYSGQFKGDTL